MGKFSQKVKGKEVGDAKVYAEPHTMTGKAIKADANPPSRVMRDPNTCSSREVTPKSGSMRVSMGDPARDDVKTTGIETRGNGCATKGRIARGPMA